MATVSPQLPREQLLKNLLPFRRRLAGLLVGRAALLVLTGAIGLIVAAMWLDTIVPMSANVRWGISRLLPLASALFLFTWLLVRLRLVKTDGLADRIDQSAGTGGEILAGWQLATRPIQPAGELSVAMAEQASRRAGERILMISPQSVFSSQAVKQAIVYFVASIAVVGILSLLVPNVVKHQLSRFLDPSRDVPPYTGVTIELEFPANEVLYGQDVFVTALLSKPVDERVKLVTLGQSGNEAMLPMLAENDLQFRAALTRVTEPLDLYAVAGASRSKVYRLNVVMTPKIMPPQVEITYPTYTKMAPYHGGLPKQGIQGLAGTEVRWDVASNRPLSQGRLLVTYTDDSSEMINLEPMKDPETEVFSRVGGSYVLKRSGKFELSVVDVDGIESYESVEGMITVVEDQRPVVRIVQPKPLSIATPDVVLPVVVAGEDDFGITSMTLFRSLNGSPATAISADVSGDRTEQGTWKLPLDQYGLEPGDELQFFARVEDNDPAGAKGAESPVTVVRIISVSDFQELMFQRRGAESMQAKYQQARRHMEQIANALREIEEANEALKQDSTSEELREQLLKKIAEAEQQAAEGAEALEKLSQMAMPVDVDQELAKQLSEMAKQAQEIAEQLEKMGERRSGNPTPGDMPLSKAEQAAIKRMLEQSRENQQQLNEEAIEPMERMQAILPLKVAEQDFVQLVRQQRDLAERMQALQSIKDQDDPAIIRRVSELESEQEGLRQNLNALLDRIEKLAQELPDDPELDDLYNSSIDFVEAVAESLAEEEMAEAQQSLLVNDFPNAQQHAATAAEILESFLSKSESMGDKACKNCKSAFKPSASNGFGNSIEQMLGMMGRKPGSSVGGSPGNAAGMGAGGGYAQRFAGPENVGMYGALPMPNDQPSRGSGGEATRGVATSRVLDQTSDGAALAGDGEKGLGSGQGMNAVPSQYRGQVADYFEAIASELGSVDSQ